LVKKRKTYLFVILAIIIATLVISFKLVNHLLFTPAILLFVIVMGGIVTYIELEMAKRRCAEDYRQEYLAGLYQRAGIGKMYRNVIIILIPIIIIVSSHYDKYIENRDYTKILNNNFEVSKDILGYFYDEGELFLSVEKLEKDPLGKLMLENEKTRKTLILASLMLDTAQSTTYTLGGVSYARYNKLESTDTGEDILTEENEDIEKTKEVIDKLNERTKYIEDTYSRLIVNEETGYNSDKLISTMKEINYTIVDVNKAIIEVLEKEDADSEEFLRLVTEATNNIKKEYDNVQSVFEAEYNAKGYMIYPIISRIVSLISLIAVYKLLRIIQYYITLAMWKKKLTLVK